MNSPFKRYWAILLIASATLTGCASTKSPSIEVDESLFIDSHFEKPKQLPQADDIFSLTSEQQHWLSQKIIPTRSQSLTKRLIERVLKRDYNSFDYDNSYTRTASKTLAMKQGNCLSMVIMTAAIARHFGIPYRVQEIKTSPVWDRDGGLYLLNGHVNIALKNGNIDDSKTSIELISSSYTTLDFINSATRRNLSKRLVSQRELTSMYFLNLAADAMVVKDWSRAYWLLRQSITSSPYSSPAWNSLAVLYRYNQQPALAELVYKHAMNIDANNMNAVQNYALLLESQGRYQELFNYQRKVDLAELENPYRYFDRGDTAYTQQDYKKALTMYKKAIKLSPFVDAFYFGLFRTYWALGERKKAVRNLQLAHQRSADFSDRKRYNAKLAMLKTR